MSDTQTTVIDLSTRDYLRVWGNHYDLTNTHPDAIAFTAVPVARRHVEGDPKGTQRPVVDESLRMSIFFAHVVTMRPGETLDPDAVPVPPEPDDIPF